MSGRRTRSRERLQSRKKRERWSRFTGELVGILQNLRIGELECGRPGGGFARVLGGRCMRERGDLIGARGEAKMEQDCRIDHARLSQPRFDPLRNLGKKG
jgi:hypothetical protein